MSAGNLVGADISLPADVREKLAELDLELSEGDITQKGYEKKRAKLLQPFLSKAKEVIEENSSKALPPYYNLREPSLENNKTVRDGALVSSEGYSYVSEVPSLPSSHQRHSNSSKKTEYYQPADNRPEPGYENSRVRRTHRKITHNEKRYHSGKVYGSVSEATTLLHRYPFAMIHAAIIGMIYAVVITTK